MNKKIILTGSFLLISPLFLATFPLGFFAAFPLGFFPMILFHLLISDIDYQTIPLVFAQLSTIWQFSLIVCGILGLIGITIANKQNNIESNKV